MKSALNQIEQKIHSATDAVVSNIAETDDAVAAAVMGRKTIVHLVINGSFLYRDKPVRTIQSSRRLVARLTAAGKSIRSENIWIIDNETIKTHYRMIVPPSAARLIPLTTGVAQAKPPAWV